MMDLSKINENSIIITPFSKKEEIVKELVNFKNLKIKFLTKEALVSSTYFTYDDEALVFLRKLNYSYDNAKEILNNITFLNNGTEKLDTLVDIKNKLLEAKLLKKDYFFKYLFNNKSVYVYGYSLFDEEIKTTLRKLDVKYSYIEDENNNFSHEVLSYESIEEEVLAFFNNVCKLKLEGKSLNDIVLYNYPSEYDLILRKYAKSFKLPIEFDFDMTLYESPLFKKYLTLLEDNDLSTAYDLLNSDNDKYSTIDKLTNIANDVLSISNLTKEEQVELLTLKAKEVKLSKVKYEESIKIVDSSYRGNKTVFMLGFSLGSYPKVNKDNDLLSDYEKKLCNRNTSKIDNKIRHDELVSFLKNNEYIVISLKERVGKEVYYDSLLINELGYKKIKTKLNEVRYNKSLLESEIANLKDIKNDYGIDSELIDEDLLSKANYLGFDHLFKNDECFKNDKKLQLSYTSIDEYNSCPFMYFIKRVCKADIFEDSFNLQLGNVAHKILEDSLVDNDITIDNVFDKYKDLLDEKFTTKKDKFFAKRLLPQVINVIEKNKKFNDYTDFKENHGENEFYLTVDSNTYLKGKIDKFIKNENKDEVIVIDYKTGPTKFDKDKVAYGKSLQLPIYSLMIKEKYKNYQVDGLYIQPIMTDLTDESVDILKEYKLNGITLFDDDVLYSLDTLNPMGYSSYFEGLQLLKTSGYKKTSKLLTKEELLDLENVTKDVINKTVSNIRNGVFTIAPLRFNKKDTELTCTHCPLKAICFVNPSDYNEINLEDSGESKGDDDNGTMD